MLTHLLSLAAGVVLGVVYHAKLQPYVTRAWTWLKDRYARAMKALDRKAKQ